MIVGDFFRELVDTEHGFWQTFNGLTLRPGTTLRRYLRGKRRPFMSPGRYLLVSAVIGGTLAQVLEWLAPLAPQQGIVGRFAAGFATGFARGLTTDAEVDALPLDSAVAEAAQYTEQLGSLRILALVALAGLAGLLYQSLFRRDVRSLGESSVLAAYAVGHVVILISVVRFVLGIINQYWKTGVDGMIVLVASLVLYPGAVTYGCFGANWWNGIKGTLGTLWAFVEMMFIASAGIGGYACFLLWAYPKTYSGSEAVVVGLVGGGIALLLHGPALFLQEEASLF